LLLGCASGKPAAFRARLRSGVARASGHAQVWLRFNVVISWLMKTKHVYLWISLGVIALAGSVFAFMNFWAAVDLCYDASTRGRVILNRWSYTLFGLCFGTLLFFGLALRAWLLRRRSVHSGESIS